MTDVTARSKYLLEIQGMLEDVMYDVSICDTCMHEAREIQEIASQLVIHTDALCIFIDDDKIKSRAYIEIMRLTKELSSMLDDYESSAQAMRNKWGDKWVL